MGIPYFSGINPRRFFMKCNSFEISFLDVVLQEYASQYY